jgi:hypothetical protein
MKIINNYDSASIEIIEIGNEAVLSLKTEVGKKSQSFLFTCDNRGEKSSSIIIKGINEAEYPKGYINYLPFIKCNGKWGRLSADDCKINETELIINVKENSFAEYAWYPPYTINDFTNFLKTLANENVKVLNKDAQLNIAIGDFNAPTIIFLARQHPGESMSSFFIEGAIESAIEDVKTFNKFSYMFFPFVNYKGVSLGVHRYYNGIDYNRSWKENSPSEIEFIKNKIKSIPNLACVVDVHGDEVSKMNFVRPTKNSLSLTLKNAEFFANPSALYSLIRAILKGAKKNGQDTAKDYIAKEFSCYTYLVEMSAKNSSPEDCKRLGKEMVQELGKKL